MKNKLLNNQNKSISYAIGVQSFILWAVGLSVLFMIILVNFTNPYTQDWALSLFWLDLFVFLFGVFSYIQFWYFFSFKSSIIYIPLVNKMLFTSAIYSSVTILFLTLLHVNQINYFTVIMVFAIVIFNWLYFKSSKN